MRLHRRQMLQALGLGAVGALFAESRSARAGAPAFPTRVVFYVQPHGHVPRAFKMDAPGPAGAVAERALGSLAEADLSPTLRPLHRYRSRILALEGLSHTSALADIAEVQRTGGDLNNHQIGVADVLTGARALQRPGTYCTGGARSIDQELALRTAGPGRFGSRVYGYHYVPNSVISPFSYLGPGQPTPMVGSPAVALADLLGDSAPVGPATTRDEKIRAQRPSVLDAAAREYEALAPRLGPEARQKLDEHRALVRDLERSLQTRAPRCAGSASGGGHEVRQFMRVVRLALACDLTRVVTFSAPVPECPELGYPASQTMHGYAHQSILGDTSCGQAYDPVAERAMTDLDAWHAGHVAALLDELDAVPEGEGTLLDHTVVVWLTELATPTHQHRDVHTVLAGGAGGYFATGRYVRYPQTLPNPLAGMPATGPAHNRLLVTLLQAMGQPDTTFGMTGATAADGTPLSFRGPLAELAR
ncbi:MAG: DUF1552 domain-containing protein [Myxococcales bacterium]|nr:DUF1552 domain-containing protein [Myxococcales bacterium]